MSYLYIAFCKSTSFLFIFISWVVIVFSVFVLKDNNNDINVVQEDAIAEVVPLSDNHTIISNDEFVEEPTLVKEEDGKIKANLDSKEVVAALDWIKELKNEDLLLNQKSVEYFSNVLNP